MEYLSGSYLHKGTRLVRIVTNSKCIFLQWIGIDFGIPNGFNHCITYVTVTFSTYTQS